ncbi:MAG: hypothetical protein AAF632_19940 [Bacteroidota bacterium]
MLVKFQRTGDRRYAISVTGTRYPDLEMNPAPGYNPFLPHDVLHLVVESYLGIEQGIFGQLAAGGHAGTFHIKAGSYRNSREESREWRRIKKRGTRLAKLGADDAAKSELAAYICWQEWLSRSDLKLHRKQASTMNQQGRHIRELMPEEQPESVDVVMDNICQCLDTISGYWHSLKVGESIQIRWSDLAISDHKSKNVLSTA